MDFVIPILSQSALKVSIYTVVFHKVAAWGRFYVSCQPNVCLQLGENHPPGIHVYADDIQLYLSFKPLSTSPQHGALRSIQASVSDKNSWDPSTQHCFYFWPVSSSPQCWLSQLTHQILHINIGSKKTAKRPNKLTEIVISQTFKLGWSPTDSR